MFQTPKHVPPLASSMWKKGDCLQSLVLSTVSGIHQGHQIVAPMDKGRKVFWDTHTQGSSQSSCRYTDSHGPFCRCQSFWDRSSKQDTKVDVFGIRNVLEEILTPSRDSRAEALLVLCPPMESGGGSLFTHFSRREEVPCQTVDEHSMVHAGNQAVSTSRGTGERRGLYILRNECVTFRVWGEGEDGPFS